MAPMRKADATVANAHVAHKTSPLLISYRRHLQAEGKAVQTIAHYFGGAQQFMEFAEANGFPAIANIKREHVELWLESLYQNYSKATVLNRFTALAIFMKWLLEEGEITRNPMERMKRPKLEEVQKDVVSPEDMARVFAYLEKNRRHRDLALIALLYDTGMRASEVADCRTEHVDLEKGVLFIPKTKTGRTRLVRLSPKVIRYLDRYLRHPRPEPEYLLNGRAKRLKREGIYWAVRRTFEELGIQGTIGAHDLRHTSASHAVGHMSESAMMTLYGWSDTDMPRHYARQALVASAFEEHRSASPMERLPRVK